MQLTNIVDTTIVTMTTREIAELTGKRHKDVLYDTRKMLEYLGLTLVDFSAQYKDSTGRSLPMFSLPKEIYSLILDKYKGLARVPNRLQEEASLKTIEQLLGIKLIRQYKVLNYRLDGYDPDTNTAYEIDEPEHRYKHAKDAERQQKIEAVLGCKFVRIAL